MQSFYDSLYHTTAVIGINSSAMLMAIIAHKPVLTILTEEYRKTQEETQHFQQLKNNDALDYARTDEEFAAAAARLLDGQDTHKDMRAKFIQRFIRPHGLSTSAGEEAAREIISIAKK